MFTFMVYCALMLTGAAFVIGYQKGRKDERNDRRRLKF